jgi:DNA-binding CsgD family transcriptional regulator
MNPDDNSFSREKKDGEPSPELVPPRDMVAHRFDIGSDAFAILEFPLVDFRASCLTSSLTESERDVMRLILQGKSNSEIARDRRRAVRTIANQVASIFRKLGIGSRCELYALAARSEPPCVTAGEASVGGIDGGLLASRRTSK